MARKPLLVMVARHEYRIVDSPEPLRDSDGQRCRALIDHGEYVIWIDPVSCEADRLELIVRAVSQAWEERLRSVEIGEGFDRLH